MNVGGISFCIAMGALYAWVGNVTQFLREAYDLARNPPGIDERCYLFQLLANTTFPRCSRFARAENSGSVDQSSKTGPDGCFRVKSLSSGCL